MTCSSENSSLCWLRDTPRSITLQSMGSQPCTVDSLGSTEVRATEDGGRGEKTFRINCKLEGMALYTNVRSKLI